MWASQKWPAAVDRLAGLALLARAHTLVAWFFISFLIVHRWPTPGSNRGQTLSVVLTNAAIAGILVAARGRPCAEVPGSGAAGGLGAALASLGSGVWSAMTLARRPAPLPAEVTDWHALDPQAALATLAAGKWKIRTKRFWVDLRGLNCH